MKIEQWTHQRVQPNGDCLDESGNIDGNVGVTPSISMSPDNGGCGLKNCNCSNGHWLCVNFGRDDSTETVSGATVFFDNWGEMQLFLTMRSIE